MPTLDSFLILQLGTGSLLLAIFAYSAYWAFNIRHALAVGIYRNQALGVGLISLGWLALSVEVGLINGVYHVTSAYVQLFTYVPLLFAIALFTFYWVDSSVRAARRSDPLLRDTLRWSKLRIVCWILMLIGLVSFAIIYGLGLDVYPILSLSWVTVPLVAGVSGAVVLPLSALRSRDVAFRRHLRWFGLFALLELILTVSSAVAGVLTQSLVQESDLLITFALLALGGYALYRSARSLVPLNRVSNLIPSKHGREP